MRETADTSSHPRLRRKTSLRRSQVEKGGPSRCGKADTEEGTLDMNWTTIPRCGDDEEEDESDVAPREEEARDRSDFGDRTCLKIASSSLPWRWVAASAILERCEEWMTSA